MFLQKIQQRKMELAIAAEQQEQEGMGFEQLNERYPVGYYLKGLCNFVVHDKDKTPIQKVCK